MFTIEMDHDETLITVLDEEGTYEDVHFIIFDDIIYIRQWNEDTEFFETIAMSPEMFDEFRESLNLPEGTYRTRIKIVDKRSE